MSKKYVMLESYVDSHEASSEAPRTKCLPLLKSPSRNFAAVLGSVAPEMRQALFRSHMGFSGKGSGPTVYKVKLPYTPQVVSSNGVGQVQVVYGLQYTSVCGISDWANVFKEYRFVKSTVEFTPSGIPVLSAADASFGAGLNYSGNITAPGSLSEVLSLDQGQVVGMGVCKRTYWHADFEKLFGEVWTDTGTNVAFATWKAFNTATGNPLSVQLGNWGGYVDIEFRGLG